MFIHPSACVSSRAKLGTDVSIGAFCVIESDVSIGKGCQISSHCVVKSGTALGDRNRLSEGVILGGLPQHQVICESEGRLSIGSNNTIREYVTIHRALAGGAVTRVGDDNLIMVHAHVAHDCAIGNGTILANNVMLAGHVTVDDHAYLSGATGVHQYCRIGRNAMVGGQARITKDVPPYVTVDGDSSRIVGLNTIGLRRSGFTTAEIQQLKDAYRIAYRGDLTWNEMLNRLHIEFPRGRAAQFHQFLASSKRGCIPERQKRRSTTLRIHVPNPDTEADKLVGPKRASA